ncbi:MAG: hypothetical protein GX567_02080, partial [Clostridia bacterium]|nr:hypothetical protein [Clostridia bacterium]
TLRDYNWNVLSTAATTVTAVTLDLDVDSNYDGSINGTDESLETSAGGVVALGKRVPIRITTQGNLGTVSLSAVYGGEKISVWSASSSGTQIQLGQPLSIGTTYTYYVQGISTSSEVRDIELRLRNTYGTVIKEDTIKLTVVNPTVDLDVDSDYDGSINDTDESLETSAGGVVFLGERVPIRIASQGSLGLGKLVLSAVYGGDKITVWTQLQGGTEIPLDQPLSAGTYYVEGIETSSYARDIELRLRYTYGSSYIEDTIKLTVGEVNFTILDRDLSVDGVGDNLCINAQDELNWQFYSATIEPEGICEGVKVTSDQKLAFWEYDEDEFNEDGIANADFTDYIRVNNNDGKFITKALKNTETGPIEINFSPILAFNGGSFVLGPCYKTVGIGYVFEVVGKLEKSTGNNYPVQYTFDTEWPALKGINDYEGAEPLDSTYNKRYLQTGEEIRGSYQTSDASTEFAQGQYNASFHYPLQTDGSGGTVVLGAYTGDNYTGKKEVTSAAAALEFADIRFGTNPGNVIPSMSLEVDFHISRELDIGLLVWTNDPYPDWLSSVGFSFDCVSLGPYEDGVNSSAAVNHEALFRRPSDGEWLGNDGLSSVSAGELFSFSADTAFDIMVGKDTYIDESSGFSEIIVGVGQTGLLKIQSAVGCMRQRTLLSEAKAGIFMEMHEPEVIMTSITVIETP